MIVYPDACAVIYWIEAHPDYFDRIDERITVPGVRIAYTELTRMECRVKPLRENDTPLLATYDHFFHGPAARLVPLDQAVFVFATELRAQHNLRTPDALHLAAALHAGCDEFWTNDTRLNQAADGRIAIVTFA